MMVRKRAAAAAAAASSAQVSSRKAKSGGRNYTGTAGLGLDEDAVLRHHSRFSRASLWGFEISLLPLPSKPALICMITSVVLYISTVISGTFPFDDEHAIVNNVLRNQSNSFKDLTTVSWWTDHWKNDFWGTPITSPYSHKSYRPFVVLTYKIDALVSHEAWIFHLTNVLWYALVVWAVVDIVLMKIANEKTGDKSQVRAYQHLGARDKHLVVTLAGLIFTCHPVHVEAVAGLVGRAELLSTLLVVIAMSSYHRHEKYGATSSILFSASLLMAACLCKETAVVMPLVFVGGEVATRIPMNRHSLRRNNTESSRQWIAFLLRWIAMAGVSIGYLSLRSYLFRGNGSSIMTRPEDNFIPFLERRSRFLTPMYIMVRYDVLQLFFPVKLSCDYSLGVINPVTDVLSTEMALVAVILVLAIFTAWRAMRNALRQDISLLLALGWVFAPLIPASHILNIGTVFAERLLFMPSVGMAMLLCQQGISMMLVCAGAGKHKARKSVFVLAYIIYALLFAYKTMNRIPDWNDMESLVASDIKTYPEGIKLCEMAARLNQQNITYSLPHVERAIAVVRRYNESDAFLDSEWMTCTLFGVLYGIKGSLYLKASKTNGPEMLKMAEQQFTSMEKFDKHRNAPHESYCDYGLTSILLRKKEDGLKHYDRCFDQCKYFDYF